MYTKPSFLHSILHSTYTTWTTMLHLHPYGCESVSIQIVDTTETKSKCKHG